MIENAEFERRLVEYLKREIIAPILDKLFAEKDNRPKKFYHGEQWRRQGKRRGK